jgi:CRISPR-associated protein Cas2
MWFVVAYDVSDDQRRAKIAELLGRYGQRVQYSVFECWLDDGALGKVVAAVGTILESPENGSVRLYRWCASCRDASTGLGEVEAADDGEAFIV